MKYVAEDEKVRTLIVEKHPFKGVENYLLIRSFIMILLRLMRTHTQKNLTLATKQIRSQKKMSVSRK